MSALDLFRPDLAEATAPMVKYGNVGLFHATKFLTKIGIRTKAASGASGLLPGVEVVDGGLVFDPDVVSIPELLHEAGHLAVLPGDVRRLAAGNLYEANRVMMESARVARLHFGHPFVIAGMHSGENEATAWGWAACAHVGFAFDESESQHFTFLTSRVREDLCAGSHPGIAGLMVAGFGAYPALSSWTQRSFGIQLVTERPSRPNLFSSS